MDPHLFNSVSWGLHSIMHNRNSLYIIEFLFNIKYANEDVILMPLNMSFLFAITVDGKNSANLLCDWDKLHDTSVLLWPHVKNRQCCFNYFWGHCNFTMVWRSHLLHITAFVWICYSCLETVWQFVFEFITDIWDSKLGIFSYLSVTLLQLHLVLVDLRW